MFLIKWLICIVGFTISLFCPFDNKTEHIKSSYFFNERGFVEIDGHIIPASKTDKVVKKNDAYYVNGEKAQIICRSGKNISKSFNSKIPSDIDIPVRFAPVALVYSNVNSNDEKKEYFEIDEAFADDIEILNEQGTLIPYFIEQKKPKAYNVGDNALVTIIKANFQSQPLNIHGTSSVILQYSNQKNIVVSKLCCDNASRVEITNNIEGNNICLKAYNCSKIICNDINAQELEIEVSGASSLQSDAILSKQITIQPNGASKIYINDLNANILNINGSGAIHISINNGKVEKQNLSFSGAVTYDAKNLKSICSTINAYGNSNLFVQVTKMLDGALYGMSDIQYWGKPKVDVQLIGNSKCRPIR